MIHRWTQTWKSLVLKYPDHIHPGLFLPNQYSNQATDHLFELLCAAYSEKYRKYQTMQHIAECFEFYDSLPNIAGKSARTELALWFHDSVMNTIDGEDELHSAQWCKNILVYAGVYEEYATYISNLIPATNHRSRLADPGKQLLADPGKQLLADVDLFILGSPPARFQEYELQIREEHPDVPDDIFYSTRSKIMSSFLNKEHIYYTPEIRVRLEDRARENLSKYNVPCTVSGIIP
jgi:predicted metal-dependent HD superfamily phosphohydrolase